MPARHTMTAPIRAGGACTQRLQFAMDHIAMNVHGDADSHIDALCHVVYDGTLYNGVTGACLTADGASELSIDVARDGIVGRGVLLDIPAVRGVPWLEVGDHVMAEDLLAAQAAQGVEIGKGDIVLVRVGHHVRRRELGAWNAAEHRAGLHPDAVALLARRHIAALGSDGNNDTAPSAVDGVAFPVHVLAVNALGLHLLDYLYVESLREPCFRSGKWSFLCVIAPLRLEAATGSPVNPIAIL
jgi:kynurenine formamidase